MPFISSATISRALRSASFAAATTRSCSISPSLALRTSGSILTETISSAPFATTVTMPPPAEAWTVFVATSAWTLARRSCMACACFMRLPRLPNMPLSDIRVPIRVLRSSAALAFRLQRGAAAPHFLHLAAEDREGLLNERIGEGFIAKMALSRRFALPSKLRGRRHGRSTLQRHDTHAQMPPGQRRARLRDSLLVAFLLHHLQGGPGRRGKADRRQIARHAHQSRIFEERADVGPLGTNPCDHRFPIQVHRLRPRRWWRRRRLANRLRSFGAWRRGGTWLARLGQWCGLRSDFGRSWRDLRLGPRRRGRGLLLSDPARAHGGHLDHEPRILAGADAVLGLQEDPEQLLDVVHSQPRGVGLDFGLLFGPQLDKIAGVRHDPGHQ